MASLVLCILRKDVTMPECAADSRVRWGNSESRHSGNKNLHFPLNRRLTANRKFAVSSRVSYLRVTTLHLLYANQLRGDEWIPF
jgi:hypothetical protein